LRNPTLEHLGPLVKLDWGKLCPEDLQATHELEGLCGLLKQLGPAARDCVLDLEPLLRHDDEVIYVGVKLALASALLHLDAENARALETLERIAASDDARDRDGVVGCLESAPVAVQFRFRGLIEKLSHDPDEEVREDAQALLAKLNSDSKAGPSREKPPK
jgi:hypothetical protein